MATAGARATGNALPALPQPNHLGDPVATLLAAVRRQLELDVVAIVECLDANYVFRWLDGDGPAFGARRNALKPLAGSYANEVAQGRLQLVADASRGARVGPLTSGPDHRVGAFIGAPIRYSNGRLYGVLEGASRDPQRSLDERSLRVLEVGAELIAEELEGREALVRDDRVRRRRIERAIAGRGVAPVFQPIIDLQRGAAAGFESLARFRTPEGLPEAPGRWFHDADGLGLRGNLEFAALEAAIARLDDVPRHAYLSVNASPQVAASAPFERLLGSVSTHRLVLEITEHAPVDDYDRLTGQLEDLRDQGLRVAVDDAGAGFSSLRHVLRLRPDLIKLDLGLVRGVHSDPVRQALTASLVSFGAAMDATIVAEGVESPNEIQCLRGLGVRYAQGYHLGRPGPLPG